MNALRTARLAALFCSSAVLAAGPDLIITDMTWPVANEGYEKVASESGVSAYSAPTFTCNIGTVSADWNGGTPNHPLISQNLFRYENGRFEQIAMGWPKHAAAVVAQPPFCGVCDFQFQVQFFLAPGCMDPYDAATNATQTRLSPRSDVNPVTGDFTFPFDQSQPPSGLDRRLLVANSEIDPGNHPDARFFFETQMVSKDDAAAGNDLNNASYREVSPGAFVNGGFELTPVGSVDSGDPAIRAWRSVDAGVRIERVDVPDDGSFYVGSRATDNDDGTWTYEYAVQNFNSHRAGGAFAVPFPAGAALTSTGFHDVHYHSGETLSSDDWIATRDSDTLTWSTEPFASNPDANALRWGTLYNFRVTTDRSPAEGAATLTLFRPGTPGEITAPIVAPTPDDAAPADLTGDGCIDAADLAVLLAAWGGPDADLDNDGATAASDLAVLLAAWTGGGC